VSIPLFEKAVQTWNAIVNVEFATLLEAAATPLFRRGRVDASWHRGAAAGIAADGRGFGDVVERKAIEAKYVARELGADPYVAARNRCQALAEEFAAALEGLAALVTPTMTTEPIEVGSWTPRSYASGDNDVPPLAINTRPAAPTAIRSESNLSAIQARMRAYSRQAHAFEAFRAE
jgi:Asp-tRNA(Asn)/Glu-tRNA(Gln) amidotransferase A subunit family amidase